MMEKNTKEKNNKSQNKESSFSIDDVKSEIQEYINKKIRLFRLDVYDKAAVTTSYITYGIVIMLMVFFIAFLSLVTLGFLLGEILGNTIAGFGVLILLSLIIFFIIIKKGKSFRRYISNLIVSLIKKIESDEE